MAELLGDIERDIKKPYSTSIGDYRGSLRLARIFEVYDASFLKSSASSERYKYGKVKILWLDGTGSVPKLLDVCKSWSSWKRGSGIFTMPEKDDIVICQERPEGYPVILGFLPYKWDVASGMIKKVEEDTVGPIRPLYSGEILLKSSSQAEVLLSKEGNIKVFASDPTNTSNVITNLDGNCTEKIFTRVNNDEKKVLECTFGYDYLQDNVLKPVGSSAQVCNISSTYTSGLLLTFPFTKSVSFTLSEDTVLEDISRVYIKPNNEPTSKENSIEKSRYSLSVQTVYTPGSENASTDTFKPCSTEKNSYIYTLSFLDNVSYSPNSFIYIECIIKMISGSIRLNSHGDLFLDGRNVVIRSSQGKSSLILGEGGISELRGIRTQVGNDYEGSVVCDSSGVKFSEGIVEDSTVTKITTKSLIGDTAYYYILDTYPLIKVTLNDGIWKFTGVTKEEYLSLDSEQRESIGKMWISEIKSLLTRTELERICSEGFPSYAELKS